MHKDLTPESEKLSGVNNDYRMSKRQKSLFAADFSAVAKSQKLLFASISLQQKSTNFLPKFVSKSKICCRNLKISTFDWRYYVDERIYVILLSESPRQV